MATKNIKALVQLKASKAAAVTKFEKECAAIEKDLIVAMAAKDSKKIKALCQRQGQVETAYASWHKSYKKAEAAAHGYSA